MPKVQRSPLAPPQSADIQTLQDYTAKVQESFEELFEDAHIHAIRSENPTSNEGEPGQIDLVDDGTNRYLVIRFESGWFKTANLTAI